jgi:hypothetical protein
MTSIQNSRNIVWIKIKLLSIAAPILKIKNLNVCLPLSFWFDTRVSSHELWVLTYGDLFVETSLVKDILFDVDIIISLLLFKHRIVNNRTAIVSFKLDDVAFVNCIILMNDYRIAFLLDTVEFLTSSHRHLVST